MKRIFSYIWLLKITTQRKFHPSECSTYSSYRNVILIMFIWNDSTEWIGTARRNHIYLCEDKKNMLSKHEEGKKKRKKSVAHAVHMNVIVVANFNENIYEMWGIAASPSVSWTATNTILVPLQLCHYMCTFPVFLLYGFDGLKLVTYIKYSSKFSWFW